MSFAICINEIREKGQQRESCLLPGNISYHSTENKPMKREETVPV